MALQDELTRLARDHKEGHVFLLDTSGTTYTPQQLLSSLSAKQLSVDTGGEGSGTETWITELATSFFGGLKSKKLFSIRGNPARRGWARLCFPGAPIKIHFLEYDQAEGRFISLCKRHFAANDHYTVFPDISESSPHVCRFCLNKLHPESIPPSKPRPPRPKKQKLAVPYEEANRRLQDAIRQALPIFERWNIRRDSIDEYWHTVYYRDHETGEVSTRFVHKSQIGEKQVESAKRAFYTIMRESKKSESHIDKFDEAERVVNVLADALRYAGFELTEDGKWIQIAK